MTTQPGKRTRFANDTAIETQTATANESGLTPSHIKQPPSGLADAYIRSFTASLHPEITTIVERLGKEHIVLLSKRDNKNAQVKRMADLPELIPRSARLDFTLNVSKRAKLRPEFIALEEQTTELVESYRIGLKEKIIAATKIEILALEDELREHLIRSVKVIIKAFMILKKDTGDVDSKVYTLMCHYIITLSVNCNMSLDSFCDLYKTIHGLDTYPPATTQHMMGTMIIPPDITSLKDLFEGVFVSSWANYKLQQEQNSISLELIKYSTTYLTEKATADAVIIVDTEPAADKPELQALVRHEAKTEAKALIKEIELLKQQVKSLSSAKNLPRRGQVGASAKKQPNQPSKATGSSTPTKKSSKKKSSASKNNNKTSKADEHNKDIVRDKNETKKSPGKNSSTSKNKNRNNKKQQQSPSSKRQQK
jgi:hypothetical protein